MLTKKYTFLPAVVLISYGKLSIKGIKEKE